MAYLVSARKYRPQRFEELVGQQHVAITLQHAIEKGKVGHAYLFSGPRGIGKTSAARILAKAMNCEKGPTPTPCNQCTICQEITEGRSLDLIEIDGASNRRIDEIRQLRENVRFVPSSSRYKVYIIDEVHMLTPEAFNALLKTLEEPPEHVIFIFATTEVHKVPATIRSRCQQFTFKRIPTPLIVQTLKKILGDTDFEAEDQALYWIAKNAMGSMRDAESMLDQLMSYVDKNITLNDVFTVLGLPRYEIFHKFAKSIANEDYQEGFKLFDGCIKEGIEPQTIISELLEYFRNLYALSFDKAMETLIDLPEEDINIMKDLLTQFSRRDINNILILLSKLYLEARNSEHIQYLFEVTLIKLTHFREIIHPPELVTRLESLKQQIDGGISSVKNQNNQPQEIDTTHEKTTKNSSSGGNSPNSKGMFKQIIDHFLLKRRAIAEFLQRAKHYAVKDTTITFTYDKKEKLSYEQISHDPTKRWVTREIQQIFKNDALTVDFILEQSQKEQSTDNALSPEVSKILQIFKGEIVPHKNNGGE